MEKIEELKREAQMKLKLSKRSFQMLSKPSEPVLLKRIKQTTEPVEFNFKTTERCKPSGSVVDNSITINPSNFPLLLRSGSKEEKTQPSNVRTTSYPDSRSNGLSLCTSPPAAVSQLPNPLSLCWMIGCARTPKELQTTQLFQLQKQL